MISQSNLHIVKGDILDSPEKYIVHQCNCITKYPKGLSQSLFQKFPYANVYKLRSAFSKPGTIDIRGNGSSNRFVINLFGQYKPGKPSKSSKLDDSKEMRLKNFMDGLQQILEISNSESIAFPYMIGCGLAGGDWNLYLKQLENFASKTNAKVFLYKLE